MGAYGEAIQVLSSAPQTSSRTFGSANASCHGCTPTTPQTQPAAPSRAGDRHHGLGEFPWVGFESAVLLGLQQLDRAGRFEQLGGVVGHPADAFGLGALVSELVGDVADVVDYPSGHDVFLS